MSLNEIEIRVLGALVEKEYTTPEAYPLSTNALLLACNQKTNRDPVSDYGLRDIEETLRALQTRGLVQSSQGVSERVVKHQHRLHEAFELRAEELALLAVLMLRGPQTPGELRSRTERYVRLSDGAAVQSGLTGLLEHRPPLARNLGRGPGQSQDRWEHTLGPDLEKQRPRARPVEAATDAAARAPASDEIAALRREVDELRARLERLEAGLGLGEPD